MWIGFSRSICCSFKCSSKMIKPKFSFNQSWMNEKKVFSKLPSTDDRVSIKLFTIFCSISFDKRSVMLTGSKNKKFRLLRPIYWAFWVWIDETASNAGDERRVLYSARLIWDSTNGIFRWSNCKHLPLTQYRLSLPESREHFEPNGKNPWSPFTK